jgi:hypothetical protein
VFVCGFQTHIEEVVREHLFGDEQTLVCMTDGVSADALEPGQDNIGLTDRLGMVRANRSPAAVDPAHGQAVGLVGEFFAALRTLPGCFHPPEFLSRARRSALV